VKPAATLCALLFLVAAPAPASAQELGRLFFTPEQRAALDARRKARLPDKPAVAVAPSPTARIDGVVRRSDGPTTVWVNGQPVPGDSPPEDLRVAPRRGEPARVSVSEGESGRAVEVKVGGTLDRGSGEARDVIGDGEIRVRRSR
jgi:hypothetical protein